MQQSPDQPCIWQCDILLLGHFLLHFVVLTGVAPDPQPGPGLLSHTLTPQELLDFSAGLGGGELIHDVQRCLVICVPDVHVHPALGAQGSVSRHEALCLPFPPSLTTIQEANSTHYFQILQMKKWKLRDRIEDELKVIELA